MTVRNRSDVILKTLGRLVRRVCVSTLILLLTVFLLNTVISGLLE